MAQPLRVTHRVIEMRSGKRGQHIEGAASVRFAGNVIVKDRGGQAALKASGFRNRAALPARPIEKGLRVPKADRLGTAPCRGNEQFIVVDGNRTGREQCLGQPPRRRPGG